MREGGKREMWGGWEEGCGEGRGGVCGEGGRRVEEGCVGRVGGG